MTQQRLTRGMHRRIFSNPLVEHVPEQDRIAQDSRI